MSSTVRRVWRTAHPRQETLPIRSRTMLICLAVSSAAPSKRRPVVVLLDTFVFEKF